MGGCFKRMFCFLLYFYTGPRQIFMLELEILRKWLFKDQQTTLYPFSFFQRVGKLQLFVHHQGVCSSPQNVLTEQAWVIPLAFQAFSPTVLPDFTMERDGHRPHKPPDCGLTRLIIFSLKSEQKVCTQHYVFV